MQPTAVEQSLRANRAGPRFVNRFDVCAFSSLVRGPPGGDRRSLAIKREMLLWQMSTCVRHDR